MTKLSITPSRLTWIVLAVVSWAGCEGDFPSYNELEGFRVLALRASPPSLSPGEATTLDALTFVEGKASPDLRYRWSWCPARLPTVVGGDCALNEADFARLLDLDEAELSFDLGQEATARLAYPGDPERYRAACENAADTEGRDAFVFSCEGGFPISVRVDIAYGDQTIRVQKEVRLLFGDLPANSNPELGSVTFAEVVSGGKATPWSEDEPASLTLGERYKIQVTVDEKASERFVPDATTVDPDPRGRGESLYISWFVSSGRTDQDRTSFIQDGVSLDKFGTNEWLLPKSGDEKRDTARMFVVLRDERGGINWLSREAELVR